MVVVAPLAAPTSAAPEAAAVKVADARDDGLPLIKVTVRETSALVGKTVAEIKIRQRFGVTLVAVEHAAERDATTATGTSAGTATQAPTPSPASFATPPAWAPTASVVPDGTMGPSPPSPSGLLDGSASVAVAAAAPVPAPATPAAPASSSSSSWAVLAPTTIGSATSSPKAPPHADGHPGWAGRLSAALSAVPLNPASHLRHAHVHVRGHRVHAAYVDTLVRSGDALYLYGQPAAIAALLAATTAEPR